MAGLNKHRGQRHREPAHEALGGGLHVESGEPLVLPTAWAEKPIAVLGEIEVGLKTKNGLPWKRKGLKPVVPWHNFEPYPDGPGR